MASLDGDLAAPGGGERFAHARLAGVRSRVRPASTAWLREAVGMAAYAVLILAFLWRSVAEGMVPLGYDLFTYFFPYKEFVSQALHHGEFPLWNPAAFMGAPLLGNIQTGLFYPPNFLFYVMPTTHGVTASVALHMFLAAAFTYLFCRVSLGTSFTAAWAAGAVFAFGGFMGAKVGQINQLHGAVWLPLLMLGLERAVVARNTGGLAIGAVALAAQLLSGHTQEVYYSGWALGLLAVYMALAGSLHGWGRLIPFAALAAVLGLGAAVAAAQLLPSIELARESYRAGGLLLEEAAQFNVALKDLPASILPVFEHVPYTEMIGYTGMVSLVLIPAAAAMHCRPPWPVFFGGLALFSLVLSLGDETPLYGWLFEAAPGFNMFRAPGRWLFLYGFSVAVVTGLGVEALRARWDQVDVRNWLRKYALGVAVVGASMFALKWWLESMDAYLELPAPRIVLTWMVFAVLGIGASLLLRADPRSRLSAGLLVALLVFELYQARVPQEYNRPMPASLYEAEASYFPALRALNPTRVLSLMDPGKIRLDEEKVRASLPPDFEKGQVESLLNYMRLKAGLMGNVNIAHGLPSLDGYDGGLLPTRRYAEVKQVILGGKKVEPHVTIRGGASAVPSARLLGMLGVSHILLNDDIGYPSEWQEEVVPNTEGVRVLRNMFALPRVYVVHEAVVASSEAEALAAIGIIDPARTLVLSEADDLTSPTGDREGGARAVRLISDKANEVILEVSAGAPGYLVLSDAYYPGWKVYVDGREARLLRANYIARAVQVGADPHVVRFAYEPLSLRVGIGISAGGVLVVVLLLLLRAGPFQGLIGDMVGGVRRRLRSFSAGPEQSVQ